jgi:hypothetical protein
MRLPIIRLNQTFHDDNRMIKNGGGFGGSDHHFLAMPYHAISCHDYRFDSHKKQDLV